MAEKIKSALQDKYGLDMINLRGQCYDGAGNMSGVRNGLAARVTQEFPKAVYTWCSSHKLNLCVVKSCDITEVRNMIDKATEVAIFFNYSPQRQRAFEEQIEIYCKENEQDTVKGELQRENKFISYERAFKMLDNDMYIAGIGQAVLELLSFKVGSGNHQRRISLLQKFSDIFGNMRLVPLKMTSHLTSHNF